MCINYPSTSANGLTPEYFDVTRIRYANASRTQLSQVTFKRRIRRGLAPGGPRSLASRFSLLHLFAVFYRLQLLLLLYLKRMRFVKVGFVNQKQAAGEDLDIDKIANAKCYL